MKAGPLPATTVAGVDRSNSVLKPENHFIRPGIAESIPNHSFDERRVLLEALKDIPLFEQAKFRLGQVATVGGLLLLQVQKLPVSPIKEDSGKNAERQKHNGVGEEKKTA